MHSNHINTLEKYRGQYNTLKTVGYLPNLDNAARQEILTVIHEAINPGYIASLWCAPCVADMVEYAFKQLDAYLASRPQPKKSKA